MTTQALNNLAHARANLTATAERAEQAHAAQSKLLVRRSEAESLAAAAFSDFRAGKISEEVAALRKASAEADANDLKALIDQGAAALVQLNANLAAAQAAERKAESVARREEDEATASTLTSHIDNLKKLHAEAVDERHQFYRKMGLNTAAMELLKYIKELEKEFLDAVAERYRIQVEMNPRTGPNSRVAINVFDFYRPSAALGELVRQGTKPHI
ncbi:hypothetical protein M0D68_06905 [Paraburkholderia sp. SEWSISQ10-3 4]|uniref:hypothetical protein n=1 Tax=Paraburkholderia TaxID=1822464 RepID=UPI00224F8BD3|nr:MULTISPECIES: hypothetical protein [Paraburkholderia]MCX4137906.1 hypothetical protein [Paraburkholderia aspalathi]MDN7170597.1 hypothetical protein [Paraburkholderia sp. SEWSISQ10-3 4]MDQ6500236.1 hypothetical protein [Paraburkholderia aspalathi]